MKKILLSAITILVSGFISIAQVSAYSFSQSTGAYTAITGGSVVATATANTTGGSLDDAIYNLPAASFPFTFTFNGIGYTGCNISTNGYVTFGATAPTSTNYTPISGTAAFAGVISAWGGDLNSMFSIGTGSVTGDIRFEVIGIAPNREAVIQYNNWRPSYSTSTTNAYSLNFQIRLQETTNKVSVAYGSNAYVVGSTNINSTRQIGLRGATNADYNNRLNAAALSFTASTAGTANTSTQTFSTTGTTPGMPVNGLMYSWTPPVPCSGTPTAGNATATSTVLCAASNVTLNLTGSTSGVTGLSYQWLSSPDGLTWNPIPTATTIATTQSVTATTYYQCAVACGTDVATSSTVTVNLGTTPNGGTTNVSSTLACVGQSVSVNLTGASSTPGLTYQWQSSPNGSTWTSITSATTSVLTQTIAGVTYYQAILSCASNTAASAPAQVNLVGTNSYATVPFLEAFDNAWQNRCDNQNVPTTSFWASNPTTGNNSWRRQDAGATASWGFLPTGPVPPIGTGAANFHSYGATANTKGDLDLFVDMNSSTSNYEMSFYNYNLTGNDTIQVWLSTNGGGSFIKKGQYLTAGSWTKQVITLGAVGSSSCVVRFRGISDYGNDDMGIDSLKIYTAVCTTPPVAGIITGTNSTTTGSVDSYSVAPTIGSLQWYSSTSATGPWNSIAGATSATQTITAAGSGTVYYTVIASSLGCPADTANTPLAVNIIFPGDNVCNAIPLPLGVSTTSYSINGSTTQTGEVVPPNTGFTTNTGWGNTNLSNTLWFTFVAPASGYVTVQAPDFDTQVAIWKSASCSDLLSASTATLVAANDDDANYVANGGVNYSSFVRAACLTPGATYYIQLDSYDTPALANSSTRVLVMDMGTALNASFTGLSANYCLPASSSSLTPVATGGVFTINTSTTSVTSFSPSSVGTSTVTYSIYGCKTTSTTVVANTPTVSASASSASVCAGSSATLTASGATNFTWTAGGNTSTEVVSPSSASVYTVTGETSGCSNTSTVSVGVTATPTVMAMTSNTSICAGSSATLTASGATNYTWTAGGNTSIEIVTPTGNSTYTVTGETSGCTTTATVSVDVNNLPTVSATASNTLVCANLGESAVLTASTAATSYTWSDGANTMTTSVTPTVGTTYTLTVNDGNCDATATVFVDVQTCTGVNSIASVSNGINIYPNPTHDILNIVIASELSGVSSVEVYDALGKLVIKEVLTNETTSINTSKLEDGMYVYKVINNNKVVKIGKVVKH